jgi:hypothetical protein|tara:strand:+ start:240 stop:1121 length:882 start_codon:yes stop_codon:yes gene_type:complete
MFASPGIVASSIGDLLDHFPNNVHSAFSVRRFNNYAGFAFRIRRNSDDVEADLYFDDIGDISLDSTVSNFSSSSSASNLGQFMASSGYTDSDSLGSADNALVATWKDQSGNGRDITQTSAGKQPVLVLSGSLTTENGVTALDFASDRLQHSDASSYSQPNTYLCVAQSDATSGNDYMTDGDGSGGRQLVVHTGGKKSHWAATFASSSESSDTDQHLWFSVFDGSDSVLGIDGGANVLTSSPGTQSQSGFTVGARCSGSNYWDGRIQEIIYYTGDHEATRTGMEFDVNRYFGIF